MRLLAIPVTILALSGAASANVLWRGDYDTGDLSQWSGFQGIASRFTMVQSPVRQGAYALRLELHQGDVTNSGTRNEVYLSNSQFNEVDGNDHWYAWSSLFPSDYPSDNSWQVFTQWHQSGLTGSPPVEFDVIGEEIQVAHNGDQVLWRTPLVRGVWHDFVVHVLWSRDPAKGFVEIWFDGEKVVPLAKTATLKDENVCFLQVGFARETSDVPESIVIDHVVEATTLAEVTPPPLTERR